MLGMEKNKKSFDRGRKWRKSIHPPDITYSLRISSEIHEFQLSENRRGNKKFYIPNFFSKILISVEMIKYSTIDYYHPPNTYKKKLYRKR